MFPSSQKQLVYSIFAILAFIGLMRTMTPDISTSVLLESDILMVQDSRQRLLRVGCENLRQEFASQFEVLQSTWWFHTKRGDPNFRFCPIDKSASSTVVQNVNLLLNPKIAKKVMDTPITMRRRLNKSYFPKWHDGDMNLYSFIFVRHPFKRLVSAYHNIFKRRPSHFNHLIDDYYTGSQNEATNLLEMPVTVLTSYIIDYHKKGLTLSLNEHVRPQYLSCDFCSSTVDFIGKVETFADDYAFVAGKIGAQDIWDVSKHANEDKSKLTLSDPEREFFGELQSRDELVDLYEAYKNDFELFGYKDDLETYLSYIDE